MRRKLTMALFACAVVLLGAAGAHAATGAGARDSASARAATPIKHVVVLYLENHSFDNLLGFWCDHHRQRCPQGGMPSSVKLSNGAVVKPRGLPDVVPVVNHTVAEQAEAINGGKMNGWQHIEGCAGPKHICIRGYKPRQEPNFISLAKSFAISDNTFSMADSPSWGGHLYAALASLDGFLGNEPHAAHGVKPGQGWGCDSHRVAGWQASLGAPRRQVPSCIPDHALSRAHGGAFERTPVGHVPSIFDRLHAKGLPWRIYGQPRPASGRGESGYIWDICPSLADCMYTNQRAHNVSTARFIPNAKAGNLPAFSIIIPGGVDNKYSEHNGFSMTAGDNWIGRVASAVMHGPEWKSTALFITYDDCGCFYDQVPPRVNPDGTHQGPRSPLVIVSPYAKRTYTDTHATTFAGILAYVERNFRLRPLGANDKGAYPFTDAFNYSQAPLQPVPMTSRPVPRGEHIDWAQARDDT